MDARVEGLLTERKAVDEMEDEWAAYDSMKEIDGEIEGLMPQLSDDMLRRLAEIERYEVRAEAV